MSPYRTIRIRDRYGIAVFRRFFNAIVTQCHAVGLIWGQEWPIDATKVAADAGLDSLQPRFAVDAHLAQLFARPAAGTADDDAAEVSIWWLRRKIEWNPEQPEHIHTMRGIGYVFRTPE